jgi:hypothetical protein
MQMQQVFCFADSRCGTSYFGNAPASIFDISGPCLACGWALQFFQVKKQNGCNAPTAHSIKSCQSNYFLPEAAPARYTIAA